MYIVNTLGPIFLIIYLGYFLKVLGIIGENFRDISSRLVYSVALPALIFMKLAFVDLRDIFNAELIFIIYTGTLIGFFISWFVAVLLIQKGQGRGPFIQGSIRGNIAIVGMAIVLNLYGDQGAAKLATILVFLIPLYNILSIIALTFSDSTERREALISSLKLLLFNPLIIVIVISLLISWFSIPVHSILRNTGDLLAAIALPLALIGIGASMDVGAPVRLSKITVVSVFIKLVIMPVTGIILATMANLDDIDLGIVYLVFACPTAIISFIMADAIGKHGKIAGSIVVFSTLVSVITIGSGVYILMVYGIM